MVSSECDNKFENGYTHGEYECGDDGKWSNKCIPSYCDLGYVFNYTSNKCVSIKEKVDFSYMVKKHIVKVYERSSLDIWTIFPLISIIFIFVIMIYFEIMKKNNKNLKADEKGKELIEINE